MFSQLFKSIAGEDPLEKSTSHFGDMLELVETMILEANAVYWGKVQTAAEREDLYRRDVKVNKLQRSTRRAVITGLSGSSSGNLPYGLMLMSLVKDIERLGDYAKNLAEIPSRTHDDLAERALPDDDVVYELRLISDSIMTLAREAKSVYAEGNRERALELTEIGRATAKRCGRLVETIARSPYESAISVDLVLATRFYKRIQGHLLNLLSSVIMPLDKLDYFDEEAVANDLGLDSTPEEEVPDADGSPSLA